MESPLPVGSLRVRLNRVSPAQGQVEVLHAHSATEGPGTCSLTVELVRAQALVPPGLAVGDRCALHSRKGSLMGIEEIAVSLSLPSNSSESFSPSQPKQTRQRSAPCSARHLRAPARYSQYLAPRAIDACREARVRVAGRAGLEHGRWVCLHPRSVTCIRASPFICPSAITGEPQALPMELT